MKAASCNRCLFLERVSIPSSFFQPGKAGTSANGQKERKDKKRVRQPHNTNEKHRQKALGQGEHLMNSDYNDHEEPTRRPSGIIGYDPALGPPPADLVGGRGHLQQQRPNSIELNRPPYGQQQQQQQQLPPQVLPPASTGGYQYNPNQEPIYTPRILRSEQPPSPQRQQPQQQHMPMLQQQQPQQFQQYQPYSQQQQGYMQQQVPPTSMPMALPAFTRQDGQQQVPPPSSNPEHPGSAAGTPTRRPNEPPPAPPSTEGTPTRQNRDSLPPPPPPPPVSEMQAISISQPPTNGPTSYTMQQQQQQLPPRSSPMHQQLMSQLNSHHQEQQRQQQDAPPSDLPPPPPVPVTTSAASADLLSARVPLSHLPPSPPPPPPIEATSAAVAAAAAANGVQEEQKTKSFSPPKPAEAATTNGSTGLAPPPPPPPPPAPGALTNGGVKNGNVKAEVRVQKKHPVFWAGFLRSVCMRFFPGLLLSLCQRERIASEEHPFSSGNEKAICRSPQAFRTGRDQVGSPQGNQRRYGLHTSFYASSYGGIHATLVSF